MTQPPRKQRSGLRGVLIALAIVLGVVILLGGICIALLSGGP